MKWPQKSGRVVKLCFSRSLYLWFRHALEGGSEDDASEAIIAAKLLEHAKILHCRPAHLNIQDAVQADDAGQLEVGCVGGTQLIRDLTEDLSVGLVRVIKSRCTSEVELDKNDLSCEGHLATTL